MPGGRRPQPFTEPEPNEVPEPDNLPEPEPDHHDQPKPVGFANPVGFAEHDDPACPLRGSAPPASTQPRREYSQLGGIRDTSKPADPQASIGGDVKPHLERSQTKGTKRNGCIIDDGGDGVPFTARWTKVERGRGNSECNGRDRFAYKGMWVYTHGHLLVSVGYSFDNEGAIQPGVMTTAAKTAGSLVKIEPIGDTRHQKWTLP